MMRDTGTATLAIAELREFAGFSAAEQRYIRCSLDVGLRRTDALALWGRSAAERASIRTQYAAYRDLDHLCDAMPDEFRLEGVGPFMGGLIQLSLYDLAQGRLSSFSAYRFLYERLLGARVRPWLPAAFCAAAALPQILPERRKALLRSLSESAATAPGWSEHAPRFFPDYVEQEVA